MNNFIKSIIILSQSATLSMVTINGDGQDINASGQEATVDSLSLSDIIKSAISQYPTVKSAEEALKNADARIGLAKTGLYPTIDMAAGYSNLGPVITLDIPSMGTFQLYPNNNYSAAVNYHQVIFDFGRTRQNMKIETENKVLGEQALGQTKQKLALAAVNNFYTLAYLQQAIRIKNEQLETLQSHLKYVETMRETGSATDYQILSTQVKISSVVSQKADIAAAVTAQQSFLNSLLGKDADNKPVVREEINVDVPLTDRDSMFSFAYKNRDEMLIAEERAAITDMRYELIRTMNKPVVDLMATGGVKNGYVPDLNRLKANYAIGIGVSVPLFDGMRTKYNLLQAASAKNSVLFETENTRRNITSEVKDAEAYMKTALQKVSQFELQEAQALKAYSLAETSFKAGTITNLELLDTYTSLSESKLMLLKARIDYAASIYRLRAVLGERLY